MVKLRPEFFQFVSLTNKYDDCFVINSSEIHFFLISLFAFLTLHALYLQYILSIFITQNNV